MSRNGKYAEGKLDRHPNLDNLRARTVAVNLIAAFTFGPGSCLDLCKCVLYVILSDFDEDGQFNLNAY